MRHGTVRCAGVRQMGRPSPWLQRCSAKARASFLLWRCCRNFTAGGLARRLSEKWSECCRAARCISCAKKAKTRRFMTLWAINRAAHGCRENYAIKIIQIKEGFCVCESGFTMYEFFKIDDRVLKAAEEAEQKAAPYLAKISETQRIIRRRCRLRSCRQVSARATLWQRQATAMATAAATCWTKCTRVPRRGGRAVPL